jgi:hypothetical protein
MHNRHCLTRHAANADSSHWTNENGINNHSIEDLEQSQICNCPARRRRQCGAEWVRLQNVPLIDRSMFVERIINRKEWQKLVAAYIWTPNQGVIQAIFLQRCRQSSYRQPNVMNSGLNSGLSRISI